MSGSWHPNPDGSGGLRWWDGVQWTQHTRPAQPNVEPAPTGSVPRFERSDALPADADRVERAEVPIGRGGAPVQGRSLGPVLAVVGLVCVVAACAVFLLVGSESDSLPAVDVSGWGEPVTVDEYSEALRVDDFPSTREACVDEFERWSKLAVLVGLNGGLDDGALTTFALSDHLAAMNGAFADCIAGRPVDLDDVREQENALMESLR